MARHRLDCFAYGIKRGGVDMIAPGQKIEKEQLDQLAGLANSKLPIKWANRPPNPFQNIPFSFGDSGWKTELERIRYNVLSTIENVFVRRVGAEKMVSGPWPIAPTSIMVADGVNPLYSSVVFYSIRDNATFAVTTLNLNTNESGSYVPDSSIVRVNCIGGECFKYTVVLRQDTNYRSRLTTSDQLGVFYIKTYLYSPDMNPRTSALPWKPTVDERVERFAPLIHEVIRPYQSLPTPYPPAELITETQGDLSGEEVIVGTIDKYTGLANYNYGVDSDPSRPHSPSRATYFRVPSYPTANADDGGLVYPFQENSISLNDFGSVVYGGAIYSITISRNDSDAEQTVKVGSFVNGAFNVMRSETIPAGIKSITFYPTGWIVFGDAPVYYQSSEPANVSATFITRGASSDPQQQPYRIGFPIHSSHYNDTEALLNLL